MRTVLILRGRKDNSYSVHQGEVSVCHHNLGLVGAASDSAQLLERPSEVRLLFSLQKGEADEKCGVDSGDAHNIAKWHIQLVSLIGRIDEQDIWIGTVEIERFPVRKEEMSYMTMLVMLLVPHKVICLKM